jgi:hypothetical protein
MRSVDPSLLAESRCRAKLGPLAARMDCKGERNWNRFAAVPANVRNCDTAKDSCDHNHL